MTQATAQILAELRHRLEELYGGRLAGLLLFGSRARGDAQPDSDIDVLVVLKGPVEGCEENARTGQVVADLSLQDDVVITCVFVSEERFLAEESELLINVRKEGVPV